MDVPVVTATRLKGHVVDGNEITWRRERLQVGVPYEVLRKGVIWLAQTKEAAMSLDVPSLGFRIGVDLLRQPERRPGVWPARIEGHMRQKLGHLRLADPVFARRLQVIPERIVDDPLSYECADRDDGAEF